MANLTIESLPDELYEALKASASENRRSIAAQATVLLERALGRRLADEDELHNEAARLRSRTSVRLTTDDILEAVAEGRP